MIMRLGLKTENRKGFSLTELLAAVLILSMVSAVVAGGIPVAKDAYEKITLSANAQVMLSTAISALRNELGTATQVKVTDDGGLEYFNSSINNYATITCPGNDVIVTWYSKNESGSIEHNLVSGKTGDNNQLHVKYYKKDGEDGVAWDSDTGIVTITGLKVVDDSGNTKAKMDGEDAAELKIRVIMET